VRALPAVAWAGFIFWLSSSSDLPPGIFVFEGIDKLFHAAAYGVLGLLAMLALPPAVGRWRRIVLAVLIASGYGATDELHQRYVRGRSSDPLDWLADTVGAGVAVGGLAAVQQRRGAAPGRTGR
jgi:VanZ family protein